MRGSEDPPARLLGAYDPKRCILKAFLPVLCNFFLFPLFNFFPQNSWIKFFCPQCRVHSPPPPPHHSILHIKYPCKNIWIYIPRDGSGARHQGKVPGGPGRAVLRPRPALRYRQGCQKSNFCSEGIQAKYDGKKMKNKDAGKNNDKGGRYEMGKRLQRKRANALKWQF